MCVYAQNITPKVEEVKPRHSGEGEDDKIIYTFRYVSAPEISQFDMLVQTHDDLRFVVEKVEKFQFKGKQPLVSHITASLVHRDDVLYRIPADCSMSPVSIGFNNLGPPLEDERSYQHVSYTSTGDNNTLYITNDG